MIDSFIIPSAPTLPPFTVQLFLDFFKKRRVKGMIYSKTYLDNVIVILLTPLAEGND